MYMPAAVAHYTAFAIMSDTLVTSVGTTAVLSCQHTKSVFGKHQCWSYTNTWQKLIRVTTTLQGCTRKLSWFMQNDTTTDTIMFISARQYCKATNRITYAKPVAQSHAVTPAETATVLGTFVGIVFCIPFLIVLWLCELLQTGVWHFVSWLQP